MTDVPSPLVGVPPLDVRHLTVAYHGVIALDDVSVAIPPHAVTGIVGPNGAGKTTFLHAVMGLLPYQGGEIAVWGDTVGQARRRIAYVPQREVVDWAFPITVEEVVMMGRYTPQRIARKPNAADRDAARSALAQVGMEAFARRQIGTLSGGQQQRVFIARALAQQAALLILDEPFTGIDAASQETIFHLLTDLRTEGRTVLLSTHDLSSIRTHCDYVLCLNRRVIAFGPAATTFRIEVLERTYGGRLFHLHGDEGMILS